LNLALLVGAQNQHAFGRRQIQPHDIAQLLDKQRIGGELEGLGAMRLEVKAFQMRRIVEGANSAALAIERRLQCVASRGVASGAWRTTSATSSSPIWRGASADLPHRHDNASSRSRPSLGLAMNRGSARLVGLFERSAPWRRAR
jgi:hypothetical protein